MSNRVGRGSSFPSNAMMRINILIRFLVTGFWTPKLQTSKKAIVFLQKRFKARELIMNSHDIYISYIILTRKD